MIQVKYSCRNCGIDDATVTIAHRKDNEDIKTWMNETARYIYIDHYKRSPNCTSLVDVKIPLPRDVPENEGVGIGMVPKV